MIELRFFCDNVIGGQVVGDDPEANRNGRCQWVDVRAAKDPGAALAELESAPERLGALGWTISETSWLCPDHGRPAGAGEPITEVNVAGLEPSRPGREPKP